MSVVMYRSELTEFIDLVDNFVSNENRLVEYVSTLYYTVTYSRDLVHAVDYLSVALCESFNELHESFCMCGESAVLIESSAIACFMSDMTVDTDSVTVSLSDNTLIIHIDELILKRRASCINN